MILAARSFLHGHPRLSRVVAPALRPVLRHLPALQADPALASLNRFALAVGPVQFVQLGAHDGFTNDPLHEYVVSRPDWSGVVVEPVPEHFAALEQTYADVTGRVALERAVVGATTGRVPFYRLRSVAGMAPGLRQVGSLSRSHVEHYANEIPGSDVVIEEEVASTTLVALLDRQRITRVDLLHMDIEGAEPVVLSQIDFDATWAPRAMLFEHDHLSSHDFTRWMSRLRAARYTVVHGRQDTWAERGSWPTPGR